MGPPRKRYWLLAAFAGLAFYIFYSPDVGLAPPTAIDGIDGSEAGLYDYFNKTCVQLRDLDWALARLKQNVDSCGSLGNSDCAGNQSILVEWSVRVKQGGVARIVLVRQAGDGLNSGYDFNGKPNCSLNVPENYGKALQKVPGHFHELHSVQQDPNFAQLDLLTNWVTADNRIQMVLSHYKDNGVPQDKAPASAANQVFWDRQEAERIARPWDLLEIQQGSAVVANKAGGSTLLITPKAAD